jgi:hypothetical protein
MRALAMPLSAMRPSVTRALAHTLEPLNQGRFQSLELSLQLMALQALAIQRRMMP